MERVIDTFIQLRNIYTLFGDVWRVRAYNNAISCLIEQGGNLNCLGKRLREKALLIQQSTDELPELHSLRKYLFFIKIPGFGPRVIKKFIDQKIDPDEIHNLRLTRLQKIGLKYWPQMQKRIPREVIRNVARRLKKLIPADRFKVVGSYRRKQKDSGDIDILITTKETSILAYVMKDEHLFVDYLSYGPRKTSFLIRWSPDDVGQVDIKNIDEDSWASALLYFTGSKMFNVKIRAIAKMKGYKLNEYGLFKAGKRVLVSSEKDIFDELGVEWLSPKERHDKVVLKILNK